MTYLSVIKWCIDASFDAHPYWKRHTGLMISVESGSIMELSWKQKINGGILFESDIVRAENSFHIYCGWDTSLRERDMWWRKYSSTRITWVLCSCKIMVNSQAKIRQSASKCVFLYQGSFWWCLIVTEILPKGRNICMFLH